MNLYQELLGRFLLYKDETTENISLFYYF